MEMQEPQELFSVWEVLSGLRRQWLDERGGEKGKKFTRGKFFFFSFPLFFFPAPVISHALTGAEANSERKDTR